MNQKQFKSVFRLIRVSCRTTTRKCSFLINLWCKCSSKWTSISTTIWLMNFQSSFIILVWLIIILSTVYDIYYVWSGSNDSNLFLKNNTLLIKNLSIFSEAKNPLLTAFSAFSNGKELFSCDASNGFDFFHGLRSLSFMWIIFGHMSFHYKAYSNSSGYGHVCFFRHETLLFCN